jgi:transposase
MFKPRKKTPEQKEFWVVADRLPKASPSRFYELLNGTLEGMKFAEEVWERCAPAYAEATRGGRPGIDPVVCFKMLMIGFFEGLESERLRRGVRIRSLCGAFSATRWMKPRRTTPV